MISFVGAKLYITFVYGLWFLYPIRCKRCQSRNQKSPVFTSESKGKQTETILNLELRNRCSTAELHWPKIIENNSTNNQPSGNYFRRVRGDGKLIRRSLEADVSIVANSSCPIGETGTARKSRLADADDVCLTSQGGHFI